MKKKISTKERILHAGVFLAKESCYSMITIEEVADCAGVVPGTVHHHFKCADEFRDQLVKYAIANCELKIVAQAIASNHRYTRIIPNEVKHNAIDSLRQ